MKPARMSRVASVVAISALLAALLSAVAVGVAPAAKASTLTLTVPATSGPPGATGSTGFVSSGVVLQADSVVTIDCSGNLTFTDPPNDPWGAISFPTCSVGATAVTLPPSASCLGKPGFCGIYMGVLMYRVGGRPWNFWSQYPYGPLTIRGTNSSPGDNTGLLEFATNFCDPVTVPFYPYTDGCFQYATGAFTVTIGVGPIVPAGPSITNLSRRSGPIAGGTSVVVTGSGFGNPGDADTVTFVPEGGGTPLPAVHPVVVSDTELDLTTPNVSAAVPNGGGALHTNIEVTDINHDVSPIGASGKFNFPVTILEIGDSIASGEGTLYGYNYDTTTGLWGGGDPNVTWAGDHPLCHDSPNAYGQVLSSALGANFVTLACTGATYVNGITTPEVSGGNTYQPAQFGGTAYDSAEPDAVVMTFGADDVQFVEIVTQCIKSALQGHLANTECLPSNAGTTVQTDFVNELPALTASYGAIASAIENRGNVAAPTRVPKIIFTDYMDPFPPSGGCPDTWPLTDAQVSYLNTLMDTLNSTIRTAVTSLSATDSNVGFAEISGALTGHTWCSADPWDYGLSIITQGGQVSNIFSTSPKSQAPFHPTPAGQTAIANLVRPVVAGMLNLPAGVDLPPALAGGSADGVTAQPGDSVTANASGFALNETVDVSMHSTPVALGSVTADGHGNINATVTIPLGTAPGSHELLFTGETSGLIATLPVLIPASSAAPLFTTDSPPLTVPAGSDYTGYFGASGVPAATYTLAPGAPAWLSLDPSFTGIVSGTPPAGTTSFTYSVDASNGVSPAAAGPFTVTVTPTSGGGGVAVPTTGGSSPTGGVTATRLSGADRIGTAAAASQAAFPSPRSADAVIVARDDAFTDALTGAPLAAHLTAPILLTGPDRLDPATQAEIQRVLPAGRTVYLLGGTSALGVGVAATISGLGYQVVRYAGADRYATAVAVASAIGDPATILLADGTDYPDALSAGAAAAKAGGAVLLTDGAAMNPATAAYLTAHPPTTLDAIGGPAAAADPAATGLAGADRYATAVLVAKHFFPSPATVGLASGANYPDALTGAAIAATDGFPVVLSDPVTLSPETLAYLQSIGATLTAIDVYGGTDAVSSAVVTVAKHSG